MAINLFQLSENDQSIYYLGQIFGSVGGVLPVGAVGTTSQIPIISQLFLTLNTIALAIGAIVVVYTTVVGLMMTAHEGEFLGKKWSGLWVPIRMVLGTACLFPASSGYSIMQIIIMWFIVQGVGAADMVWSAVIKGSKGIPVEQSSTSTSSAATLSTEMLVTDIFKGLVCQNTMLGAKNYLQGIDDIKVNKKFSAKAFDRNAENYEMGPSGACGRLVMCKACSQNTVACHICDAQRDALAQIIPALDAVAAKVAGADIDYIKFYNSPGGKNAPTWITDYCNTTSPRIENCCVKEEEILGVPQGTCDKDAFYTYISPDSGASTADMSTDELNFVFEWAMPTIFDEPDPAKWGDFIDASVQQYNSILQAAIDRYVPSTETSTSTDEKEKYGWIAAGAFYYDIIKTTQNNLKETTTSSQVVDPSGNVLPGESIQNYRNNYNSAQALLDKIAGITRPASQGAVQTAAPPTKVSKLDYSTKAGSLMTQDFMNNLTKNSQLSEKGTKNNAFTNVAVFGQNLLIIAQVMYAITLVAYSLAAWGMGYFSATVLGTGVPTSPGSELIKAFFSIFGPAFFALLSALFVFGALLGMYIPMVPYIVFTVTVIGWFIAVIEAMVAGPVIAIGLLSPGGQSEVFGRAEPSIMIIFNLFLRPSLMVTGLAIAMFLANIILVFINFGFLNIMGAVMNFSPGLVENIIFIAIYVSLVFTSMNQVFTLIHHIPERILTYIGGQAMQYGEAQAAQATKQAVESAAGGMAGAMKGGAEGPAPHMERHGYEKGKQARGEGVEVKDEE